MTNAVRVFAKLCARTPPFFSVGGSTGEPEMDSATAAALCHGLDEHPYQTARFLWTQDLAAMEWVRIELRRRAMELSQTRWMKEPSWPSWAEHIKRVTHDPASLALADMVILACARPSLLDSVEKRRLYLDVSERTWHRHIKPRYNALGAVIDNWAQIAFAHVMSGQREEE